MNVEQKLFETWCNQYCAFLKKNWEGYCQASMGYINGYKTFREKLIEDLRTKYGANTGDYSLSIDGVIELLEKFGEDKHTVWIEDHQLGTKSTGSEIKGAE